MKKTIKTAIAMLLAIIIACGSLTAFAAAPTDISWYFGGDEPMVYSYAGELTVGDVENEVKSTEENPNVYCTFEAEEEGYYRVTSTYYFSGWFGIPERFENGAYHETKDRLSLGEYIIEHIYYLEADEYIIGFDFHESGSEEVTVEFLGDIADMEYDESAFDNLILDYSIYEVYEEDSNGASYYVDIPSGANFKFTNGYEAVFDYVSLCVYTDEALEKGEYEVEVGFWALPYRETAALNVNRISDIIAKIEMTNADKYAELVYHYNGEYLSHAIEGETLTVTYTDGTVETVENFDGWYYLEKCNLWVDAYYDYDYDLGDVFAVEVVNERYIELPCTYRDATVSENLGQYGAINLNSISRAFRWLGRYFENVMNSYSIADFFGNVQYLFSESAGDFLMVMSTIFSNTAEIIWYYF